MTGTFEPSKRKQPWLVITGDFVRTGGMDFANFMLARHLAREGHEVHLVAHRVADELIREPGIQFHRVPKPLNSDFLGAPVLDQYGRSWARRIALRGGRVVVNGGNCFWNDVNWAHYVHAAYGPVRPRGLLDKLKLELYRAKFLADERHCFPHARTIISNSIRTKHDLVTYFGLDDRRIKVVYYGTDHENLYAVCDEEKPSLRRALGWKANNHARAMFVGALSDDRKGFDLLIESWRELCADSTWDVDLTVVGGGSAIPNWKDRVASTPVLQDRVTFMGFRQDVARLLRAADVLVAPTRYEAYGLAVHEALCCGIPALVSSGAGVAERYPETLQPLLLKELSAQHLVDRLRTWRTRSREWSEAAAKLGEVLRAETWETQMQLILNSTKGVS
jgi:glycosyltransferase involved in cell wall biosynthesis